MSTVANLTERITLQGITQTKQANGEVTDTYTNIDTIWADAFPVKGSDGYEGDKKTPMETYRFIIRYRSDIDTDSVIVWRGKTYDIKNINPYFKQGYNNYTEIEAVYTEGQY